MKCLGMETKNPPLGHFLSLKAPYFCTLQCQGISIKGAQLSEIGSLLKFRFYSMKHTDNGLNKVVLYFYISVVRELFDLSPHLVVHRLHQPSQLIYISYFASPTDTGLVSSSAAACRGLPSTCPSFKNRRGI